MSNEDAATGNVVDTNRPPARTLLGPNRRSLVRKLRGPIALALAIATGAIGAFQTINQLVLVPASLPVTLALDIQLSPIPGAMNREGLADLIGLDATIRSTNFGARNVVVLAGWFELRGFNVEPGVDRPGRVVDDSMAWCGPRLNSRYGQEGIASTLIETGRILDNWAFEPGEIADTKRLFLVRPQDFDFVRLYVNVILVKGSSIEWTDDPVLAMSTSALAADTSGYCQVDLTGDVSDAALYQTTWLARDGGLLPWDHRSDALAVQWRLSSPVYHAWGGTEPCDQTEAEANCALSIEIGGRGPDEYAAPYIATCQHDGSTLFECQLIDELSQEQYEAIQHKFGITSTYSSVDYALWAIGEP